MKKELNRVSRIAKPKDPRIQVIEEFVPQEDGTKKYVRTTRSSFGCCSYEIIRDKWLQGEITREMIASDNRELRRWIKSHENSHAGRSKMNIHFSYSVPTDEQWELISERLLEILDK